MLSNDPHNNEKDARYIVRKKFEKKIQNTPIKALHLNDFPYVSTSLKIHIINMLNETIHLKLYTAGILW